MKRKGAFAFNHWICLPHTIDHNFHFLHFLLESLTSLSFSLLAPSSTFLLLQTVSKIVRFLGKNVTEKVFLRHFSRLCSDVSFHVRRACAANFGEICSVVGKQLTESILVSIFFLFLFLLFFIRLFFQLDLLFFSLFFAAVSF